MNILDFVTSIYFSMWYILVGISLVYMLSSLDDLFIDIYYWSLWFFNKLKGKNKDKLTYDKLIEKHEQKIAVLIPCWQEANVIGKMLHHNLNTIDYEDYHLFIGVYPNDPETLAEIKKVKSISKKITYVVNTDNGPTNKAANLNTLYNYIKNSQNDEFDIYVLHDAEDIIHPLSFKLYNYMIPEYDMVQIPIFPLQVSLWSLTHWLYAEEFAENHTKNIWARQSISGHVPSAGVGTAFSQKVLQALESAVTKNPFSVDSLTEDYRISILVRLKGCKQIFVNQKVIRKRWVKSIFTKSGYKLKYLNEIVATRAFFPQTYSKSVRQKARWIIGIVFQEIKNTKWPRGWRLRYMLVRDRKAGITHLVNGIGYLLFIFWSIYSILITNHPEFPSLFEQFHQNKFFWWLIVINFIIMVERLGQRVIATTRIYGLKPLFLSVPRTIYGNILNLQAVLRAYIIYFGEYKGKNTPIKWDKTIHQFPNESILFPDKTRLGDLLLAKKIISEKELREALIEQDTSGERLGEILTKTKIVPKKDLLQFLSIQYQTPLYPLSEAKKAKELCNQYMPKKLIKWLGNQGIYPLATSDKDISLGISDPTNTILIQKTLKHIAPHKGKFFLINEEA